MLGSVVIAGLSKKEGVSVSGGSSFNSAKKQEGRSYIAAFWFVMVIGSYSPILKFVLCLVLAVMIDLSIATILATLILFHM